MIEPVVDASVSVTWFVREELSAEAELLLASDAAFHAPDLLVPEFANAIWKKVRLGTVPAEDASALVRALIRSPLRFHPVTPLVERALAIAAETSRTVYDSVYVALAESLQITLVTADDRLANALLGTRWSNLVVSLRTWAAATVPTDQPMTGPSVE